MKPPLPEIVCSFEDGNLYIILPSGRSLTYPGATLVPGKFEGSVDLAYFDNSKKKLARDPRMVWIDRRERCVRDRARSLGRSHRPLRNSRSAGGVPLARRLRLRGARRRDHRRRVPGDLARSAGMGGRLAAGRQRSQRGRTICRRRTSRPPRRRRSKAGVRRDPWTPGAGSWIRSSRRSTPSSPNRPRSPTPRRNCARSSARMPRTNSTTSKSTQRRSMRSPSWRSRPARRRSSVRSTTTATRRACSMQTTSIVLAVAPAAPAWIGWSKSRV